MGAKRVTVRTLRNGQKVYHRPDGTQKLVPTHDAVKRHEHRLPHRRAACDRRRERFLQRIEEKREAMDAGTPVPNDKRPF